MIIVTVLMQWYNGPVCVCVTDPDSEDSGAEPPQGAEHGAERGAAAETQ